MYTSIGEPMVNNICMSYAEIMKYICRQFSEKKIVLLAAGFIHNLLEQVGKMTFCPRRKCTSHKKR